MTQERGSRRKAGRASAPQAWWSDLSTGKRLGLAAFYLLVTFF